MEFWTKNKKLQECRVYHKNNTRNWKKQNFKFSVNDKKNYHESKFLSLNIGKAKKELNWEPRLNLQETFKLTIDWYKSYFDNKKIEQFTSNQIEFFLKK